MYIKRGDIVKVIAGDDRNKTGAVLRVDRENDRVVVEGCNKALRHVKPSQRNQRGGQLSVEMPIHVSNVMLLNPELGRGVRVGIKTTEAGAKVLVCRKTGRELRVLRQA